jgi:uncharacterized membrane protein
MLHKLLSGRDPKPVEPNLSHVERLTCAGSGSLLALAGIRRGGMLGTLAALAGGALLASGISGYSALKRRVAKTGQERRVAAEHGWDTAAALSHSVIIQRPIGEVYAFCREFRNLPQFMRHLKRVDVTDDRHSHWVVESPLGSPLEWDTVITEDWRNQRIAWESATGAALRHTGWLQFDEVPGAGTQVQAFIAYEPPAGELGRIVARLWGEHPGGQTADDLRRLKTFLEAGQDYVTITEDGD